MNTTFERLGSASVPDYSLRISAVVLHWKRSDNVNSIVKFLITRAYIDEVIVWNNHPDAFVCSVDSEKIRVVNSETNLKDRAKYEACAMAKNDSCYYQDDDFNNRFFIDSFYFAFCLQPERLHTLTDPITWYADWRWTYYDAESDIHAQFGWIGGGAMLPKSLAVKHLKYLDKHFSPEEQELADMAFSLLQNQPVVRIQVGPLKLNMDDAFSLESDFFDRQLDMQLKVGKVLQHFGCPEYPLPNLVIRSVSPDILLFTSYLPIDFDYREVPYLPDSTENLSLRTRENIEHKKCRLFREHCYSNALNPIKDRYWKTTLQQGDEWGVVLTKPAAVQLIHYGNSVLKLEKEWEVVVDTEQHLLSMAEIFTMPFHTQSSLKFRYVGQAETTLSLKISQSRSA